MTLIEEAEAMAERLERGCKKPTGKRKPSPRELEAAAIILRMVAELRGAETSLSLAMGEVNALKDALAQASGEIAELEVNVDGLRYEIQYPRD